MFVASAAVSGLVSFCLVRVYRKRIQNKYEAKMDAVDNWLNRDQ